MMNDVLLERIEREVLSWPGVSKETGGGGRGRNGFWVPPATIYRFGRRHLGHVHHNEDGLADFSFPKEVREDLLRSGRAILHPAFPDSRTDASHRVRGPEDLPGVVDLFRINYERAVAREARHAARTNTAATRREPS
jgi:hypothetical protein